MGVSELVASMILLFIASSLGVFLYSITLATTNSQVDNIQNQAGREIARSKERFRITAVTFDQLNDNITIGILNYGELEVTIANIYVNNAEVSPIYVDGVETDEFELAVSELELCWFQEPVTGDEIKITVVSERGISHVYTGSIST
jgi:archaellum component FlaF (FlaF/FlaG flagellin family)